MWIDKLVCGVIELDTPIGPRYLEPSFVQRAQLLWTFRNFCSLPQQVLRPSEARLIDRLASDSKFVSRSAIAAHDRPVIGRIERPASATVETLAIAKPPARAVAERSREAAA